MSYYILRGLDYINPAVCMKHRLGQGVISNRLTTWTDLVLMRFYNHLINSQCKKTKETMKISPSHFKA